MRVGRQKEMIVTNVKLMYAESQICTQSTVIKTTTLGFRHKLVTSSNILPQYLEVIKLRLCANRSFESLPRSELYQRQLDCTPH